MPRLTAKLRAAAEQYIALQDRAIHPAGSTDSGGRWYPVRSLPCCGSIRTPSRSWPWSLMDHCRTIAHVAADAGVDVARLRWAVSRLRAEDGPTEHNCNLTYYVYGDSGQDKVEADSLQAAADIVRGQMTPAMLADGGWAVVRDEATMDSIMIRCP